MRKRITLFLFFIFLSFNVIQLNAQCIDNSVGDIVLENCNADNSLCTYSIDLCAIVPNSNPRPKRIEYSVEFDSDGDGDFDDMVMYTYDPSGSQPLSAGTYCLEGMNERLYFTTPPNALIRVSVAGFIGVGTNNSCNSDAAASLINATDELNPLPVELSEFRGWLNNTNVILQWKTLSEINSSHFVIERARGENQEFEVIGMLASQGESVEEISYAFIDDDPGIINIYRLKMVDKDETYEYSPSLKVETNQSKDFQLKVYPNPVYTNSTFNIVYPKKDTEVEILLLDSYGKEMYRNQTTLIEGENIFRLDLSEYPVGYYYLTVKDMEDVRTQRILVLE